MVLALHEAGQGELAKRYAEFYHNGWELATLRYSVRGTLKHRLHSVR